MSHYVKSRKITHYRNGKIKGTFTLSNKTKTHFEISKDGEWQQWGNTVNNLYMTVRAVEELVKEQRQFILC